MIYQKRDYQQKAIENIREEFKQGFKKVALMLPVGGGKTRIAQMMIKPAIAAGKRVYFVCDRLSLISQTAQRFFDDGFSFGIIQGDNSMNRPQAKLQICSVQTLKNRTVDEPAFCVIDECFPGDVEILTESGFNKFNTLDEFTKVAQYDEKNSGISFVYPNRIIKKQYCGKLINIKSKNLCDLPMTPGHELLVKQIGWKKQTAKNIKFNWTKKIPVSGKATRENLDIKLPALAKLMIAIQADGSIHNKSTTHGTTVAFGLTRQRKIDNFLSIMHEGGFRYSEVKSSNSKKRFMVYGLSIDTSKDVAGFFRNISNIDYDTAVSIIDEMVKWDGHIRKNGNYYYSSTDEKQVDFYQAICAIAGHKTNKTFQDDNRKESYKRVHRLFIQKNTEFISTQRFKKTEIYFNGIVYCASVPTGNIIVRKNGKVLIVGNCHTGYKHFYELMRQWNKTYFVGLSATPWARGLGQHWQRLVAGPSPGWLIGEGYLSNYRAIVGHREVDVSGIKTSVTSWGKDFNQKEAGQRINKKELVADIVDTWLELAENRKTMVFAQNVAHATEIAKDFQSKGIDARKVDCYMRHAGESPERVIEDFRKNKFKVIVSVDLITKGFDVTDVECIVIARITQSLMWHIQALGRGLRAHEGKEFLLILDHAGNINRLGFPDDDLPTELDDGKKEPRRKVKPKPKPCPKCRTLFRGQKCPNPKCDYERNGALRKSHIETVSGKMVEVSRNGKTNGKVYTTDDKRKWYGMFLSEQHRLGKSDKWLLAQYKSKFDVWPRNMDNVNPEPANTECSNWLKHQRIKWVKSKKRKESA